jgi:hypothetical protein
MTPPDATLDHRNLVSDDAAIAAELTQQYHRATGGMIEVLKFGAMMKQLRNSKFHDGIKKLPRGRNSTDGGITAWLKEHCPEVAPSSAWRLEDVADGVEKVYQEIVGTKVAKQYSLPQLVLADAKDLPEPVRAKQLELFGYVAGTTRKSWLDQLSPAKSKGGKTYERDGTKGKITPPTMDQKRDALRQLNAETGEKLRHLCEFQSYVVADDAEIDGLIDHLSEALKRVKAWQKMNTDQREAALLEAMNK